MILDDFLPISKLEMTNLGWEQCDFVIVTGDAYVDHPSFGTAVIGRVLLDAGYKVGIISQPDWRDENSIDILGEPRLGFLVNSGNIDSMVNHYSVGKRRRRKDSFTPGGESGKRPDRAVIVYSNLIKRKYKYKPIIIGGIEASLRRFAHYDYWDDKVRRSVLFDSNADLLIYGMGERAIKEVAEFLDSGIEAKYINHIPGTCYLTDDDYVDENTIEIESFEVIAEDKIAFADAFNKSYKEQDPVRGKRLIQKHDNRFLVQNPPAMPLEREELDWVFNLGYMRNYHPSYEALGGVPAIMEVQNSIISERGCFGNCSFCALAFHQGRIVKSRSEESILKEAIQITESKSFKGYINDVGGATANFRNPACKKQMKEGTCVDRECLYPKPCPNLDVDHSEYMSLLDKIKELPNVKKVFIRSGIRYDYVLADKNSKNIVKKICRDNVSGQLKIAPEHIDDNVLRYMGKPGKDVYEKFVEMFKEANEELNMEQYVIPYLMSSHPASTIESSIKLAQYLKKTRYIPEQVQDFYPTPGTLSTCMFYTGIDPKTKKSVYVAKSQEEKSFQRSLMQFNDPRNYDNVYDALVLAGRRDLIGDGEHALIRDKNSNSHRKKKYRNK